MTPRYTIDTLGNACAGIRRAREEWDATDLSQIYRCNALVEGAVSALQEFIVSLKKGEPLLAQDPRPILAEIQEEATRMNRLVDAGLAFQRGLRLRFGDAAPAYGASGTVIETPSRPNSRGLEA